MFNNPITGINVDDFASVAEFKDRIYENLSNDKINIEEIARYFEVSKSAVITRAKWLGYVAW